MQYIRAILRCTLGIVQMKRKKMLLKLKTLYDNKYYILNGKIENDSRDSIMKISILNDECFEKSS